MLRRYFLLLPIVALVVATVPVSAQSVRGMVLDSSGTRITAARITLFSSDTLLFREVRANSVEPFEFGDLPPGEYRLGVAARGYEYQERTVAPAGSQDSSLFVLTRERQPGRWDVLGDPGERLGGTNSAALLQNGKVFYCHDTQDPVIFDPAANRVTTAAKSQTIQGCNATALLPDGRVIFAGGTDRDVYGPGTRQVKTYDWRSDTWTVQPDLVDDRWYPSMVQLANGDLLATGGGGRDNPVRVTTSEVMDRRTLRWSPTGPIAIGNEVSPIVLLHTGEVLMTHRPPQLYNPATRQWRRATDFVQANRMANGDHSDHELVLLGDGRVVAIGFLSLAAGEYGNMVEIYDPVADRWTLGTDMLPKRSRASLVPLPDGTILVIGGSKEDPRDPTPVNRWGSLRLTDVYDPRSDSWRRLSDVNIAREYHATPLLVPDGRVIIVGGEGRPGEEPAASVLEGFTPPYLLRGVRPSIENLSGSEFTRGDSVSFRLTRTNAPTSVILMSTSANSHFMESGNSRFLELGFTESNGKIVARIPADSLRLPDGFYMLIAMVDDIPSVARILRVSAPLTSSVTASRSTARTPGSRLIWRNTGNEWAIELDLPSTTKVMIDVVDLLGRRVLSVLDDVRGPGCNIIDWNSGGLAPGTYFVRIRAGNEYESLKANVR